MYGKTDSAGALSTNGAGPAMATGHQAVTGAVSRSASTVIDGYDQKRMKRGRTRAAESFASHVDTSENNPGIGIIKRLMKSPAGRVMAQSPWRNSVSASTGNDPVIIIHRPSDSFVQRQNSYDSNKENASSRRVSSIYAQAPPAESISLMPYHADVSLHQAQTAKLQDVDISLIGSPQTGMTSAASVPDSGATGSVSHGSGKSSTLFVQSPRDKIHIETHNTATIQQKADTSPVHPVPGRQTHVSADTEISSGHIPSETTGTALSDMNGNLRLLTSKSPQAGPGQSSSGPDYSTEIINRMVHGPGGWTIRYMGGISPKHKAGVVAAGNIIQRRAVSHGQNKRSANTDSTYGPASDQRTQTTESPAAAPPGHLGISIIQRYTKGPAGRAMSVPAGRRIFYDFSRYGATAHNACARGEVSGLSGVYAHMERSTMPSIIQQYPDMRLPGGNSFNHDLNSASDHAQTAVTPAFVQKSALSMPLQRSKTVIEHSQLNSEAPQAAVQRSASQQAVAADSNLYQPVDESSITSTSETQNQLDIVEMVDRIYAIIEERLIIERESLGLS